MVSVEEKVTYSIWQSKPEYVLCAKEVVGSREKENKEI